ncbi:MAG TPA: alkaline phosphatase family protein, partial [Pirellulales bacterium]|nr:alkaline phosphatase family protein [Pirellulales bacterium]
MPTRPTSNSRRRWLRRAAAALALLVVAGVWVGYQFPGLFMGRKSSVELLADIFRAPVDVTRHNALAALKTINKAAVAAFVVSCALPDDAETRLVAMVRDERTEVVAVPFVYYLYEMYGAPVTSDADALADLGYGDDPPVEASGGLDLATLVRQSPRMKQHVVNALRLFDALFLHGEEGADGRRVYDAAAYDDIKAIVREVAGEALGRSDDALNRPDAGKSEYVAAFEEILRDDEKLSDFIEFFTDFIRDLTGGWLESFAQRVERRNERREWVESCINARQYYRIADYARAQAERKLVVHVAVDGLQGKLLEGLAQLSQGEAQGAGARYLADLVERHQQPEMSPAHYPEAEQTRLPPLGRDVAELARRPAEHSEFLENFKRQVFGPDAEAVVVKVATVDTPTISVRNLPIVYSGHAVAGPFGTGIPNFSYLDRATERGWYFWGSDVLHFRRIFANREDEFHGGARRPKAHGARTLFERLWRYNTVSAMPTVDNGALEKISAEVGTAIGEVQRNFIEKAIVLRLRRRAAMERELNDRRRWLVEHRNLNDGFLAELLFGALELATFREHARYLAEHDDEGLPDYLLWYNPWPDHFAHGKGPYSDEIIGYRGEYDRLDHYFGKLVDVYASVRSALADTTYRDRTLFGIVSDHGLIYTPRAVSTETALFQAMRRDGIELRVLKLTQDEGGLPAIHGSRRLRPTRPFDAVVGSTAGGSYIIDLFPLAGLEGDRQEWQRHPDYHELQEHRLLSGG